MKILIVEDEKKLSAAIEKLLVEARIDRLLAGEEPAADHEENRRTILFRRLKHVKRQRHTELASVNDVFRARDLSNGVRRLKRRTDDQKQE